MTRLLIASRNAGKIAEIRSLLEGLDLELTDPVSLGLLLDVEEHGESYLENAQQKALVYSQASSSWALADDSGLEVDVLEGAPGPLSARLAGPGKNDGDRRAHLLKLLEEHSKPWKARFQCSVVLAGPTGSLDVASGTCEGQIINLERGEHGFGYDPIFLLAGTDKTMAELTMEEKNRLSHRAKAVKGLIPVMKERLGVE